MTVKVDFKEILENIQTINEVKDCTVSESNRIVKLGMSQEEIEKSFGTPKDILPSEYGFNWNIYHENFQNYIQIGIKDDKVVGMYTNSQRFSFKNFGVGSKKEDINLEFGTPLDGIVKGSARYLSNGAKDGANFEVYKIDGAYVTFFYDTHANNSLTSVNIIDCDVEQDFDMLYAEGTDALKESFEMQNFYVTNSARVRNGLSPFYLSDELFKLALSHSCDMAHNKYFSHYSLNGDSVLERANKRNIKLKSIGENLAMGAQNSLYLHELLMNSEGHRANILGDFTHMGTGVAFDSNNTPYLTQNFLK